MCCQIPTTACKPSRWHLRMCSSWDFHTKLKCCFAEMTTSVQLNIEDQWLTAGHSHQAQTLQYMRMDHGWSWISPCAPWRPVVQPEIMCMGGRPQRQRHEGRGDEWGGSGEGCALPSWLEGLGECCELPSGVRDKAPATNAFSAYSRPQNTSRRKTNSFSVKFSSMNYWSNNNFVAVQTYRGQLPRLPPG